MITVTRIFVVSSPRAKRTFFETLSERRRACARPSSLLSLRVGNVSNVTSAPRDGAFFGRAHRAGSSAFTVLATLRWTDWDTRAFARGWAIALLLLVLVAIVTAASDEGGLAWGVRAGRTLPLAPVCGAIGAWLSLAPARSRGDERALAALGRSPWQREAAAIAGGGVVALLAALAIAVSAHVDVGGFYPRAEESLHWRHEGGRFLSDGDRWAVARDGEPIFLAPPLSADAPTTHAPRGGRAAAALATAALGLALPMLVARARSRRATILTVFSIGGGILATLLAFQAAAAALLSPSVAILPPLLLLALAVSRYRGWAWSRAKYPR